jgi:hypothetical protein
MGQEHSSNSCLGTSEQHFNSDGTGSSDDDAALYKSFQCLASLTLTKLESVRKWEMSQGQSQ